MPKAFKIAVTLLLSIAVDAVSAWGYVPLNLHQYYYVTRMPHRCPPLLLAGPENCR
jgi:hypothetical protein